MNKDHYQITFKDKKGRTHTRGVTAESEFSAKWLVSVLYLVTEDRIVKVVNG